MLQVDLPTGSLAPSAPATRWNYHPNASGFSKSYKIHRPHETNNHTSIRVSFRNAYNGEKCAWLWQDDMAEHSRLAKK